MTRKNREGRPAATTRMNTAIFILAVVYNNIFATGTAVRGWVSRSPITRDVRGECLTPGLKTSKPSRRIYRRSRRRIPLTTGGATVVKGELGGCRLGATLLSDPARHRSHRFKSVSQSERSQSTRSIPLIFSGRAVYRHETTDACRVSEQVPRWYGR